ncbi:hypothetical protein PFUGPA_04503 [Plasmodium falciparum Palo Alto/Uganda]|uniref:Uncharacterized protein n=1 Tax=Plasmodium falciparum (isolate Palo Alto / Uganda) TaxID=57270 RepID=W4IU26_PLAFP|nr:hypothetical protein PFUGPA_04503 [Plasmodium falciparum Palo Alto/Uganda]
MLIFVAFSNIIGKYLKDINRNYSFLLKLIKKNIFYILIPVGNNLYNKFTLFLGIYLGIIFLTFLLLSASKRIDILFLSINDMYPLNSKKHITIVWIVIFFIYINYRFLDNEIRYILCQYVYQLITLLILFYINFNFFWLSGIKETVNKLGKLPLISKFFFTFLNEFSLLYLEIIYNVKYRISFFFIRQFINILIIPLLSMLISSYLSNMRKKRKTKVKKGIKYILGTKIYDMLLNKYIPPKSEKFPILVILASFLSLILYNAFSKYKTSHKFLKIFLFLLISLFLMNIITVWDFTLFEFLLSDFNFNKIVDIILNYEVWILCMLHCIVNLSIHSGLYFYTSKGLSKIATP